MDYTTNTYLLIRHGESEINKIYADIFDRDIKPETPFTTPDPEIGLTKLGERQARELGHHLLYESLYHQSFFQTTYCYVSPYKRARATATLALDALHQRHVTPRSPIEHPLLREREWGELTNVVMARQHKTEHFGYYHKPQGGESFADLYTRVALFFNDVRVQKSVVLIFGHGEWIRVARQFLLRQTVANFMESPRPTNCSITKIEPYEMQLP